MLEALSITHCPSYREIADDVNVGADGSACIEPRLAEQDSLGRFRPFLFDDENLERFSLPPTRHIYLSMTTF